MLWFILALFCALTISLTDLFRKKALKDLNEYEITVFVFVLSIPVFLIASIFTGIPKLGPNFWWSAISASITGTIGMLLYTKGIKSSDLSITVPMIAFTPLFLLVTSPIILGEFPSHLGLVGVILIVLGSYILNIKEKSKGYLAPMKALLKEKGPRYALIAAFIWGIGTNFDKIGIQNSSVMFYLFSTSIIGAVIIVILMKNRVNSIQKISKNTKKIVPVFAFGTLSTTFHMMALKLAIVPYVISVKRTGIIFTVLIGYFFFKEKGIRERLTGTIIMFIGILLIVLS